MAENTYAFDMPKHHKSIIKVIGVGGGGSNAVNYMFNQGIKDVEFVVCNTDSQALQMSPVPNKLQIGINLTSGLGAGADPEKGKNAAIESKEEIREVLGEDTRMIFITAGMGGGTGTGAAPVIASVAQEMGILTVGIVTSPFGFEGRKKSKQANGGIDALKEYCDTVLVILNDKIKEMYGNLSIREAFGQADNVLTTASKGIAEIITVSGHVNVDFEDVKTVMKGAGAAVMGSSEMTGENRARRAAEAAINSPLLNNHTIAGAKKILLSIVSGEEAELQMDELTEITDYMQDMSGEDAEVIFGHGVDPTLGEKIRVTIIATGFSIDPNETAVKTALNDDSSPDPNNENESEADSNEDQVNKVYDLESSEGINQISLFGNDLEDDTEGLEDNDLKSIIPTPTFDHQISEEPHDPLKYDFELPESRDGDNEGFTFELESDTEGEYDDDYPLEELIDNSHLLSKKTQMMEARRKREETIMNEKQDQPIFNEGLKEKWEIPAFERKCVKLQRVPHSMERNISKFSLNDDNQIMGDNKFLHDNVD
ncbi:MAG: cell division protein FtsZ [Flammeovirgaceae bacterium]|nr:cell division protein FtsZ [Flammeovirgaceae bacterium]